jgi:hypothetical protein
MAWARTSPNADEPERPLTESDYKTRRPHGNYKELVSLEKLVTKSKREGLRAHVVAAGLTYGEEEDVFHTLFKTAWSNAALPLLSMSDGSNVLPTIHVTDLCSVVLKLLESDATSATTEKGAQVHDYARMNSLLALGRGDEAVTLLQARAKAIPDDYEPRARLASALFRLKRFDEASVAVDDAIRLSYGPRRLRYLSLKADIEGARGDVAASRAALQRIVDDGAALDKAMKASGIVKTAADRLAALDAPAAPAPVAAP